MRRDRRTALYVVALVAVAVGIYARFAGLGSRQLAVDEYYWVRSIEFILSSGLPAFPSGGYYIRGIFVQYVTAAFVLVFGDNGFGWRLPDVLFSLASVPLAFVYARRHVGPMLAAAVAIALLLSSWQIEFARFARMYSGFQFVTLLFLISIDSAYFSGRWVYRFLPHVLAVLAVLSHALGIFLVPLLFLPAIGIGLPPSRRGRLERFRFAVLGAVTTLVCLAIVRTDFRGVGVTDALPEGLRLGRVEPASFVRALPHWSIGGDRLLPLAILGLLLTCVVILALSAFRDRGVKIRETDVALALLVVTAAAHVLVLFAMLTFVLVFRYRIHRRLLHPLRTYAVFSLSVVIVVAWLTYALVNRGWLAQLEGDHAHLIRGLWYAFFGWPDLYHLVLLPWVRQLPLIAVLTGASVAFVAVISLKDPLSELLRNPAMLVVYVALCVGMFPHYSEIRYFFFIYPVILCTVALALRLGVESTSKWGILRSRMGTADIAAAALFLCSFALSRDFNPKHIASVTSDRVGFRLGEFEHFADTWYYREDYQSPAEFVNRMRSPSPLSRVVVENQPPVSYYLRDEHAVYYDPTRDRLRNASRRGGTLDVWSDERLLFSPQGLRDYTERATDVWLIRSVSSERQDFSIEEVWAGRLIGYERLSISADQRLEVVRVRLSAAEAAGPSSPKS